MGIVKKYKFCIPNVTDLKLNFMSFLHLSPLVGHSRFQKFLQRARVDFICPGLKNELKKFIKDCEVYQHNNVETIYPAGLLQPLPMSLIKFGLISPWTLWRGYQVQRAIMWLWW